MSGLCHVKVNYADSGLLVLSESQFLLFLCLHFYRFVLSKSRSQVLCFHVFQDRKVIIKTMKTYMVQFATVSSQPLTEWSSRVMIIGLILI